ncbi:MAG TPA: serine/threonine-protein kinase, partial [Kofleriaceae bacterium]|nr:serine/threonine-protein kinase [Kofleriaceae bacterium]
MSGDPRDQVTVAAPPTAASPPATPATTRPGGERAAAEALAALPEVDAGAYQLGDEIGRGGMGRVVAAVDRRHRRAVALKLLGADAGPSLQARFVREALLSARLEHPGIVPVHEVGRLDGQPFIAMRRIAGRNLAEVIAATGSVDDRIALLPEALTAIEAVAHAHGQGILHRDLKPANVIIGDLGDTVVIDWGLAKDLEAPWADDDDAPADGSPELSRAGTVMGTPGYMAPEQARGDPADFRSDVYALGAMLHHLLAGASPSSRPALPAELPDDLAAVVARAMAADPGDRYASAADLAADLERWIDGRVVNAHAYSTTDLLRRWLRRHRTALAAAALLLLLVSAAAAFAVRRIAAERDAADAEAATADRARADAD